VRAIGMAKRYSLIYVEDDDDIRTIAEMALDLDPRFEVRSFSSSVDALGAFPDIMKPVDLVLLDVRMPGMDGLELRQQLRKFPSTRQAAIVFMTAAALSSQVATYEEQGAQAVIEKPFDPLSLAPRLAEIIEQNRG